MRSLAPWSSVLMLALLAGCAEVAKREPRQGCQRDDQCDGLCVSGQCRTSCASEADCASGEACEATVGGAKACIPKAGPTDGGTSSGDATPPKLSLLGLPTAPVTTRAEFGFTLTADEPLRAPPTVTVGGKSATLKSTFQAIYSFGYTPAAGDDDGAHQVVVEAYDLAGNKGTASGQVVFAITGGPGVTDATVANTTVPNSGVAVGAGKTNVLQIVATASSALSTSKTHVLLVGTDLATFKSVSGNTATFEFTVPAAATSGARDLQFTLYDLNGVSKTTTVPGKLVIDASAPLVTVTSLGTVVTSKTWANPKANGDTLQVKVTASDGYPMKGAAYVKNTAVPPLATFGTTASAAYTGPDGPVDVCFVAEDVFGNRSPETCATEYVDTTKPSAPASFSPAVNGRVASLAWGAATDAGIGVKGYKVYFGGTAWDGVATEGGSPLFVAGQAQTLTGLPYGAQLHAKVVAVDLLDNEGPATLEYPFTVAAPFEWLAPKFGGPLVDKLRCLDALFSTCFAVTGGLSRTTDGGNTWRRVDYGSKERPSLLEFRDASVGVLGLVTPTAAGYVLVTVDGGNTWSRRPLTTGVAGTVEAKAVTWPDPSGRPDELVLAVQIDNQGTKSVQLHRSTDGGKTFTKVSATGLPTTVSFLLTRDGTNGSEKYILGSTSGRFENVPGGLTTWSSNSSDALTAGAFVSKSEGVLVGTTGGAPRIYVFNPSSQSFTSSTTSCATSGIPSELHYPAAAKPWMVVGGLGGSSVCKSIDGGASWSATGSWALNASGPLPAVSAAWFAGGDSGLFAANDGGFAYLAKTTDGGASFSPYADGLWRNASNDRKNPAGLFFLDAQHGWLTDQTASGSGYGNGLYRTTDGGATWTRSGALSGCAVAPNLVFGNTSVGFAFGQGGLCNTSDGGATWSLVPGTGTGSGQLAPIRSVDLVSASPLEGYFVAAGGEVRGFPGGAGVLDVLPKLGGSGSSIVKVANGAIPTLLVAGATAGSPPAPMVFSSTSSGPGTWSAWTSRAAPPSFTDGAKFGPLVFPGRTASGYAFSSEIAHVLKTTDAFGSVAELVPTGATGIQGGFFSPSCESMTRCFALATGLDGRTNVYVTEDGFGSVTNLTSGYGGWPGDVGRLFMLGTGQGFAQGNATLVKTATRWQ